MLSSGISPGAPPSRGKAWGSGVWEHWFQCDTPYPIRQLHCAEVQHTPAGDTLDADVFHVSHVHGEGLLPSKVRFDIQWVPELHSVQRIH